MEKKLENDMDKFFSRRFQGYVINLYDFLRFRVYSWSRGSLKCSSS